jgi:hypothetical protein
MQEKQDTTNNVNKLSRKQIFVQTENPSHNNLQSFKLKRIQREGLKVYHFGNCSMQSHNESDEREREQEREGAFRREEVLVWVWAQLPGFMMSDALWWWVQI